MPTIFGKTYEQLMVETIDEISSDSGITNFSPGGKARALLSTFNRKISEQYNIFDRDFVRGFISGASGRYLDFLGELLGVARLGSTRAVVSAGSRLVRFFVEQGTFGQINSNTAITIPDGTQIRTSATGGNLYVTQGANILPTTASELFISVSSVGEGSSARVAAGALRFHNFTNYARVADNLLRVENVSSVLDARDIESDTNYRFRIANALLTAEKANLTAIRIAALTTPGVGDVVIQPRLFGIGTADVLVQSIFPSVTSQLLTSVRAAVEQVVAGGTYVNVRAPKEYGVAATILLNLRAGLSDEEKTLVQSTADREVIRLVNRLNIGDTLFRNEILQRVLSLDQRIKSIGTIEEPFQELSLYIPTRIDEETGKRREDLLADFTPPVDGRIIIEPSIADPVRITF